MTKATLDAVPAQRIRLPRLSLEAGALGTLFWLTLRQHARSKKLLILSLLFTLPSMLAVLIRAANTDDRPQGIEIGLVYFLIPHVLVTLTAILYASGMIQDEIEDQTLTYLLVRPLPKWAIYLTKLLATILVTSVLAGIFTIAAQVVIYWGTPEFTDVLLKRGPITAGILALSLVAYCSLFGCISLFTKRSLIAGIAYSIIFEGMLANIDFAVRKLTVMYYFRLLVERWTPINWPAIEPHDAHAWAISLEQAPTGAGCVWTLLIASFVITALAMVTFSNREFRVKTPEGS